MSMTSPLARLWHSSHLGAPEHQVGYNVTWVDIVGYSAIYLKFMLTQSGPFVISKTSWPEFKDVEYALIDVCEFFKKCLKMYIL